MPTSTVLCEEFPLFSNRNVHMHNMGLKQVRNWYAANIRWCAQYTLVDFQKLDQEAEPATQGTYTDLRTVMGSAVSLFGDLRKLPPCPLFWKYQYVKQIHHLVEGEAILSECFGPSQHHKKSVPRSVVQRLWGDTNSKVCDASVSISRGISDDLYEMWKFTQLLLSPKGPIALLNYFCYEMTVEYPKWVERQPRIDEIMSKKIEESIRERQEYQSHMEEVERQQEIHWQKQVDEDYEDRATRIDGYIDGYAAGYAKGSEPPG